MVIGSLRHLAGDRVLTVEEERKALILGWCIEWVGIHTQFIHISPSSLWCVYVRGCIIIMHSSKPFSWFRMTWWTLRWPGEANLAGTRRCACVFSPFICSPTPSPLPLSLLLLNKGRSGAGCSKRCPLDRGDHVQSSEKTLQNRVVLPQHSWAISWGLSYLCCCSMCHFLYWM